MSGYRRVNYYELCRLCTTTEGVKMHIFREEGRRLQLARKIGLCLPLEIAEDDSLPKIVCLDCVDKLGSFYEFRESCVNAEAMLESYFSSIRAEEHRGGQIAAVYVRDPPVKGTKAPKVDVTPQPPQIPAPATIVVPVGTDGLSNLIQAAGIQIISESDAARLQPLLGTASAPIIEASDGTKYTYLNNAVTTPEMSVEKNAGIKNEKSIDNDNSPEQHNPQVQQQTITFASAGQEMMVHFNLKDSDGTNPQLQKASLAQISEFLKMNVVDGPTLVKDPTIPGGLRIVGVPQTMLTAQQLQEQQHQQQIQQLLQTQSLQCQELEQQFQQQQHHQQQQQQPQQQLQQQSQQQPHNQPQQISQVHLQQQTARQPTPRKRSRASKAQIQLQHQSQVQPQTQQQHLQQQLQQQQMQQEQQQQEQQQQLQREQQQQLQREQQQREQQQLQQEQQQEQLQREQQLQQEQLQQEQLQQEQLQQEQLQQEQQHLQMHIQQPQEIQSNIKVDPSQHEFSDTIHPFGSDNEHEDDVSNHEGLDQQDSLCTSIEAVVSGAGGQDVESRETEKFIYGCDDCNKLFKRKEHLSQHQKLHTGERPYICPHCDKTFIRKEHLLRHSISHAGTKQFECEQCGKNFGRKDNLHKHRKTHTSEGPFECQTCGKSFVVKHYYMMHLACHGAAVEGENGDVVFDPLALPFKCDICGKGYPTKAFCESHRLRHRKITKKKPETETREEFQNPDGKDSLKAGNESETVDPLQIQITHHQGSQDEQQPSDDIRQLIERNNVVPVTLQTNNSNGISTILPQLIQQMVPSSSPAVIQVQSSANGTTYICTPEMIETYRRMQSS